MAENAAAAAAAPKPAVRYKTEDDVRKLLAGDNFKKFCKKKCGECHAPAFKKFLKVSPLVVRAQVGSFWCASCGRLLCDCLLYTSPSPRDATLSRMPSSA